MSTPQIEAIQYVRFSSKKQMEGRSEERQTKAGEAWCKANGYKHRIIIDRAKSGHTGEHRTIGNLKQFLDDVEAGKYKTGTIIMVEALDRLSREELMVAINLATGLIIRDMVLTVIDSEGLKPARVFKDKNSLVDLFELAMGFGEAHKSSDEKKKRVREAWDDIRKKAYDGRPVTATLPYAYKLEGRERDAMGRIKEVGKIAVVEEHAQVVVAIFDLTCLGWSSHAIARLLNGGRYQAARERRTSRRRPLPQIDLPFEVPVKPPTKGKKASTASTAWSQPTVRYILHNRSYLGEFQPYTGNHKQKTRKPLGPVVEDYYPPIVTRELWDKAQVALKGASNGKKTHRMGSTNLFSGINRCLCCGTVGSIAVKQSDSKSVKKIICRRSKDGSGVCAYKETPAADVEGAILTALRKQIDPQRIVRDVESSSKGRELISRRDSLRKQFESAENDIDETVNWLVTNRITGELLDRSTEKIERLRAAAKVDRREHDEVSSELSRLCDVVSGVVEVVAELDRLIPYVVGGALPVQFRGKVADVRTAIRAAEAKKAIGEDRRDAIRAQLKLMVARLVQEVAIDPTKARFRLTMLDGEVVEGGVPEVMKLDPNDQLALQHLADEDTGLPTRPFMKGKKRRVLTGNAC